jgi:hypothetical protein
MERMGDSFFPFQLTAGDEGPPEEDLMCLFIDFTLTDTDPN